MPGTRAHGQASPCDMRPIPRTVARTSFVGHSRMSFQPLNRDDIGRHINELLEQAAGFVRGGDLTGAVARAYWARTELDSYAAILAGDEWAAEELRARVEHSIQEYEHLLQDWQRQNVARQTAYVKRERAAIGAAPDAEPGASSGNVHKRTWRSRALAAVRTAFAGRPATVEELRLRSWRRGNSPLRPGTVIRSPQSERRHEKSP